MNYYNEFDPKTAAWLRALIAEGLIPKGEVDERSIVDVQPGDLKGFTQCHFFAGIGGWPKALALAQWPESLPVWTGSCPCQPFSCAGSQEGVKDPRHLWPYFFRLIRECRPDTIFGEQVEGAIGHGWLDGIQADLERESYAVGHCILGAHSVGAPHRRQRLYWVADYHSERRNREPIRLHPREPQQESSKASRRCANCGEDIPESSWQWSYGVCPDCGVADTESLGRQQQPVFQSPGIQRQAIDPEKQVLATCGHGAGVGGLADTAGGQREQLEGPQRNGLFRPSDNGAAMRMGSPIRKGLEGHAGNGDGWNQSGRDRPGEVGPTPEAGAINFWSSAIWHQCTDNKARRISPESALFPLAHGLPGRVGLLRGAGNAIVPEVAAEFIKAFLECQCQ